ncbi:phosphoenolpyruvate--protein phosphotransferase [Maricaulis alexandrii]|jgi:phosphotransferase system, enzyme I, PtsP|uniref:phosphoenolpyruvate--protein phosphotransferase n=1 Tax=Maricaulis alexandrii TaxID=2570354 RepID=UPI0011085927|nr:phosphoenolpyruvate--protein phosphotransferase [Maricaulis alexandrii]
MDDVKTPSARDPRRLLKRMRELMAVQENAQARLDHLTAMIAQEAGWDVCSIYLARQSNALELCATFGLKPESVHSVRLQPGEGLVGLVARRARPLSTSNARAHPAFSYKPETGEEPFNTFVGVPILRGGRMVGVLTAQTSQERQVGVDEIETLQTVAMVLAEIVASGDIVEAEEMAGLDVRQSRPERFQGGAYSGGVVQGVAVLFEPHVESTRLIAEDSGAEEERLDTAINSLRASIDEMLDSGRIPFGGPTRDVLQAYRMFAHDRGWMERLREAVRRGLTAEAAVERVRNENRARLMKASDPTFRERLHDLEDLANRLLRHLEGDGVHMSDLPDNAIIIARNIGPAELLEFDREKLKGIALEEGSASSHAAIVAKALRIPLVGRLEGALDRAENGDPVILDGEFGILHIRPQPDVVETYEERIRLLSERRLSYAELRGPAVTKDGVRVGVHMNAGLLIELMGLDEIGADGVGLFRTEFQFMVSETLPRLSAQAAVYKSVLDAAGDKPVVFRTLDLGGDKVAPFAPSTKEPNPALGWRAIRMGLDRPGLLRYQMRALIQAAEGRPLQLMFPMIAAPWEMRAAREMLDREIRHAKHAGHPIPSELKVGMMLETPGMAWALEHVIDTVDFVSVGANDLMQYFFAADRQNTRVSDRYDVLSPSALDLLKRINDVCVAHDTPVSVCGEVAAKPLEAAVLIALGYRSLSMASGSIGPVKKLISGLDAEKLGTWLASRLESPADSLRPLLLEAGEDAGLPREAVENGRAI